MEYKVLAATKIEELEHKVAQHIEDGWVPLGGVAVMPTAAPYHNFGFYQAVERFTANVFADLNDPQPHRAVSIVLNIDEVEHLSLVA